MLIADHQYTKGTKDASYGCKRIEGVLNSTFLFDYNFLMSSICSVPMTTENQNCW